ncbi:MAG TPA: hypothetical protein VIK53_09195, partial [Verrucomicrobiae bacterium]
ASKPVSLADEMAAQLSSRIKGNTCDFVSKTDQLYMMLPKQPKLNPKFWLRDVTNILATSIGGYNPYWSVHQPSSWLVGACLSPVSPRHCIATTHVTGGAHDIHLWLLPNGSLYTNTIIASTNIGGDVTVCLMAKPNPTFYRVLPDISSKVSGMRTGNYTKSKPALAVLLHDDSQNTPYVTTFTAALLNCHAWCGHTTNQLEFGNYSLGYTQISGDSSSPILTVINNEAVFICQVYGPMSGPAPGMETNKVNAAMASLSKNNDAPVYQLTPYDVSAFPDE